MPKSIDHETLIKKLISIEAWATGLLKECQHTRRLLEAEDVSTSSNNNRHLDEIAAAASAKLRKRLLGPHPSPKPNSKTKR